jgi:light-regulated signal transduction histidine kinase (bacteriophytochrome)
MLLQDASLPEELVESLSLVMASSRLLLTLVNNMLDVRKVESNMMNEFDLISVDSASPIQDAVNFCRPLATTSHVALHVDLCPNAIVQTDPLRQQQVLINLISNSIKHSPSGGMVSVQTRILPRAQVDQIVKASLASGDMQTQQNVTIEDSCPSKSVLVVSVTDQGQGIAPGEAHKLFRKFSQLENASNSRNLSGTTVGQPSGTGIGLNLCLRFVQLLGGNIWANNNKKGCTFSFFLPLIMENETKKPEDGGAFLHSDVSAGVGSQSCPSCALVVSETPQDAKGTTTTTDVPCTHVQASSASKYRILLVDDTLMNRKVFDRMLKRIGARCIKTASSGQEALNELSTDTYDLVISDIQMPGMDSIDMF